MEVIQKKSLGEVLETYLKLLYSPSFANSFFANPANPLLTNIIKSSNVNKERLAVEHFARYKNFLNHMLMSLTLIKDDVPHDILDQLAKLYCDSAEFWDFRGRSLVENFCLFAYKWLTANGQTVYAEYLKFQGIVAGLKFKPTAKSPWNNPISQENEYYIETYHSPFKLADSKDKGRLPQDHAGENPHVVYEIRIKITPKNESVKIYESIKSTINEPG